MNQNIRSNERWKKIITLVETYGYLSVRELSQQCAASEITIRRDLEALSEQKRIQRTHGGAASLKTHQESGAGAAGAVGIGSEVQHPIIPAPKSPTYLFERVDALITTSNTDRFRGLLPVIAEATPSPNALTCIATDNYAAGKAIGRWAGEYAKRCWEGKAFVLDLTYHLPNTIERSRGFFDGLRETTEEANLLFSLNTHSRHETAYQLTKDAITTDPRVNIIFAINDQSALGAIQACEEIQLDPRNLIVIPFGLEGNTMLNLLERSPYCQGGLAMFPEIVGRVCLEAAVAAYNHHPLPNHLVTPFAVVEKGNLDHFYHKENGGWKLRPEILNDLDLPLPLPKTRRRSGRAEGEKMPQRVGMAVGFWEHEWYKNLCASLVEYGQLFGIEIELIDMEQTIKDEIELRRREIACRAAEEVRPGEVVFIDAGPMDSYLADFLAQKKSITVITNSMAALERLKNSSEITLVATGGVLRIGSQAFVGPTAEHAIREMRVDHLFLTVTGVSENFGLSHTNISEVTIKQTMIRSARRVVLLADHSMFESDSTIQVAPLNVVHCLVTDDALPASARVQISQMGIQVIVSGM